jgi:predicted DNA-binding transcriptional regulator YafY
LRPGRRLTYRARMVRRDAGRAEQQSVRLVSIIRMLSEGARPTVRQLVGRFGVSRETIYRDIRLIERVGYPLASDEAGRIFGRLQLAGAPSPMLPAPALTRRELTALAWAVKQAGHHPLAAAAHGALSKLRALALDGAAAESIARAVDGWERGVKDYGPSEPFIAALAEAIFGNRRCRVSYQSLQRDAPRAFDYDPYRLVFVQGALYCLGYAPERHKVVTLAVDRLHDVRLTDETFTVDPGFDPERYRTEAFGVVWEEPMRVLLRFRPDQAPYVQERQWHPTQKVRALPDGGVELTFRAGGLVEITRWILGWGASAEVVEPARLRRAVAQALRLAAARYLPARRRTTGTPRGRWVRRAGAPRSAARQSGTGTIRRPPLTGPRRGS